MPGRRLNCRPGCVPDVGGLRVELASTALVGLSEGARYVVEYPFGCVEQRASRALVLAVAADLGDAFHLPGIDARESAPARAELAQGAGEVPVPVRRVCVLAGRVPDRVAVLHQLRAASVYQTARAAEVHRSTPTGCTAAYDYLESELSEKPPVNEGWWPAYTAWEAFAVKVLVAGGRNQDSNINRLYQYLDRMPVFALAYLHDALAAERRRRRRGWRNCGGGSTTPSCPRPAPPTSRS